MSAIEKEEDWPTGNLPAQKTKRRTWRPVAFIFNLQRSAGKVFKEATWIGSPAVPEQLLATALAYAACQGVHGLGVPNPNAMD